MFNYIADINCLVSCGGLDNENPEVRKARYEILLFLSFSVVKFELIIFLGVHIIDVGLSFYTYEFVCRRLKIPIVREDYLGECIRKNRVLPFDLYKIETTLESSKGCTVTVKVKGRSAVHEASGLQDTGHILEDAKSIYNTTLNMSDLTQGVNRQGFCSQYFSEICDMHFELRHILVSSFNKSSFDHYYYFSFNLRVST
jgi:poly [ADP-ribose] polymerase